MGILRADVISHSPIEGDAEGSLVLDGTGDYLTFGTSADFTMGRGDFTVEFWYYLTTFDASSGNYYFFDSGTNKIRIQFYNGNLYFGDDSVTNFGAIGQTLNTWYHVAGVRKSGVIELFLNGVSQGTATTTKNNTGDDFTIGNHGGGGSSGDYEPYGYMSNFRLVKGTAVYTDNFVVPRFPLKNIPGTVLLGLQSSGEIDFSVKPSAVTAHGNAAAASLSPLKKDKSDVGIVFGDNTKFDTLSYMVPPGGTTTESNRGRGVLFGGGSPGRTDRIDYIDIPSGGNSIDFGNLACGNVWGSGAGASSTRGVFWGGENQYTKLDYVTIATTANATSFGTSSNQSNGGTCMSSETRAVFVVTGGNIMEYVTIATTGNTTDFGDQNDGALSAPAGLASPTRGIVSGGYGPSPYPQSNTIQYITIATTGNASDFGDLTFGHSGHFGVSSTTRGVFAKGYTFPSPATTYYNTIEYITIASTGNATDFGDATNSVTQGYSHASHTRGVFAAGTAAADINTIDYITIATTGNAKDFGDTHSATRGGSGTSDCHGGIA